jgi:hypothetical protein
MFKIDTKTQWLKNNIKEKFSSPLIIFLQSKINSSLTNKTIQLLNTQTKQKQHKKQQIK